MFEYRPGEVPGRPLNYDELMVKQLDTIAQDIRGEDPIRRTIVNIKILEIFSRVDNHDDAQYTRDVEKIGVDANKYLNANLIDLKTGKPREDMDIKAAFYGSLKKMEAIMDCLVRKGRFPSKFAIEDDAEMGEAGPVEEVTKEGEPIDEGGETDELHTLRPADDDKVAYPQE
jgi:uncharacterized protein YicC (UPF0701 family)